MNRRGFLRIVEATIAVMIILTALVLLSNNRQDPQERDLSEILPPLLEEIAQNATLRRSIIVSYDLDGDPLSGNNPDVINNLMSFLSQKIPVQTYSFDVRVCAIGVPCPLNPWPGEAEDVFSAERVISSSVTEENFSPRKVKIFLWRTR